MRLSERIGTLKHLLKIDWHGPHMLAFLPALCLAAYWGGGEVLLVICALGVPLFYAFYGGFSRTIAPVLEEPAEPPLKTVAKDFMIAAQHHGQTAGCFQLSISGLEEVTHQLGDEAAREATTLIKDRLKSTLRESDHVYQTGDTRFVVLIAPNFRLKLDSLLELGKRLRDCVEEPFAISGTTRYLTTALGIAPSTSLGRNPEVDRWLDASALALSEAKSNGPSSVRVWSEKLARQNQSRRDMREDLVEALDKGQIQAHFQPQVSMANNLVTGMEALARWEHPTKGTIPPKMFLRALEDSGQMEQLGLSILAQALAALRRWDDAGFDVPTVSVNFSAVELRNPSLPEHIRWELQRLGLPAHRLSIEVLESVIFDGVDDVMRKTITELADMGCRVELDDFGTGHASITTLQTLPIHRVKIDQSFVKGAETAADKKRMLSAMLGLIAELELDSLAEGVETLTEHGVLKELGCKHAQGFLFAKPMPADETHEWLNKHYEAHAPSNVAYIERPEIRNS